MSTILEALAVIRGKDATGNAFDSVANKIGRISRAAKALNRDTAKQIATAARAEQMATRTQRASTAIGHGVRAAAGAAAAYEGSRAARAIVEHTAKAASDRQHEEVRMSASGMTEAEIREAGILAGSLSAMRHAFLWRTSRPLIADSESVSPSLGPRSSATNSLRGR